MPSEIVPQVFNNAEFGQLRVIKASDGHVTISRTPKVTGKGQTYFLKRFGALKDGR